MMDDVVFDGLARILPTGSRRRDGNFRLVAQAGVGRVPGVIMSKYPRELCWLFSEVKICVLCV